MSAPLLSALSSVFRRSPGPPLQLAFLGCGRITALHSLNLLWFRNEVRCHYASRSPQRAAAFNARFRGAGAFASYAAALASRDVDAVVVATPPAQHKELVLAALAAGKHVLVEKPAFPRAADCAQIEAARRQAGPGNSAIQVMVAENCHYKPLVRTLREQIRSGAIGEVRFVQVNILKQQRRPPGDWRDDPELACGGALYEGGVHYINLMSSLGLTVQSATGSVGGSEPLERSAQVHFRYVGGALGSLSYSWEIPTALSGLRLCNIYGRRGRIVFQADGGFVAVIPQHGRPRLLLPSASDLLDLYGYRAMFRDFLDAVRLRRPPRMTLARAQADLAVVERVYASAVALGPGPGP